MAVGLSWAHVLGDAFSVEEFMNMLGRVMSGYEPGQPILNLSPTEIKSTDFSSLQKAAEDPISLKRVGPVGDNWINVTKSNMEAFSFDVNPNKLVDLQSKLGPKGAGCATFQALSAVIWHAIAKIRGNELEPKVVTICKRSDQNKTNEGLGNKQIVSVVKADFAVGEANPSELAALMKNTAFDERKKIEEAMEKENGLLDCIVYGANLTFVNLEDEKLYDFKYGGQKPVRVSYKFDGVGDEGAVLVLPGLNDGSKNVGGRTVMMILPENEIAELKSELKIEGLVE